MWFRFRKGVKFMTSDFLSSIFAVVGLSPLNLITASFRFIVKDPCKLRRYTSLQALFESRLPSYQMRKKYSTNGTSWNRYIKRNKTVVIVASELYTGSY